MIQVVQEGSQIWQCLCIRPASAQRQVLGASAPTAAQAVHSAGEAQVLVHLERGKS